MPRITQDQKHHASLLLASGHTHAEVRQATGPGGKFPLARKPISAGSVVNLSRRMRDEDDVHYRKRRVDANTITFAESIALDGMLRRTGTMYTEELTRGMEAMGHGLAQNFPESTVNDHMRDYLGYTVKRSQRQRPGINSWEVTCMHVRGDRINPVRTTPCDHAAVQLPAA
jgi:hypothetical protein